MAKNKNYKKHKYLYDFKNKNSLNDDFTSKFYCIIIIQDLILEKKPNRLI